MKQKRLYPAPVFSIFFKTMINSKAYFQTSRPYKSAKTGAGFTLIELLVVISIIGLLANAAIDNFFAPYIKKPTDPQDNTRGRWGYVYGDHYSGIVPYDGYVLSNATYIEWTMEGSVQPASCSPGRVWSATANWFDCLYVLN